MANIQPFSTLAKIIVGEISHTGNMKLGHNVQIGYFAQNQAEYLDGEKTVLDTMIDSANENTRSKVRDMLGSFLFRGDEVGKKVKVLSGGERNRLALCKLLLQPFNVLIMDEPTNHLDIKSKNVLKEALKSFEGTLILVSHDRDFLQNLTSTVYEFKDHRIREYLGDIDFYLEQRNVENMRAIEKRDKVQKEDSRNSNSKQVYNDQKRIKSLSNKLSNTEAQISKIERDLRLKDEEMLVNYELAISKPQFLENYQKKKKELETLMKSWEVLQEELESLS